MDIYWFIRNHPKHLVAEKTTELREQLQLQRLRYNNYCEDYDDYNFYELQHDFNDYELQLLRRRERVYTLAYRVALLARATRPSTRRSTHSLALRPLHPPRFVSIFFDLSPFDPLQTHLKYLFFTHLHSKISFLRKFTHYQSFILFFPSIKL